MTTYKRSAGFSAIVTIIILIAIAGLGIGGWYVWSNHKDNTAQSNNTASKNKPSSDQPDDAYANWQTHTNSTYKLSFKYPSDWKLHEGSNSTDSATKQEYAINLMRKEEVKYNTTVSIQILNETLNDAAAWYDGYFAQSSLNKVTRSSSQLKGKQSIQYVISNSGIETKLHLFSVGDKTYLFTSINEELNSQADANYWTKFDKVLESLQIT